MTTAEDHDLGDDQWIDEDGVFHASGSAAQLHAQRVNYEVNQLRVREDARRVLARERSGAADRPVSVSLADLLVEPEEPITYRVDGLLPSAGRALLAAQGKAGKTTLVGNLLRCLVDGDPFLDRHEVIAPAGRVALLDTEMPRGMLRRWLTDQRIRAPGRLEVYSLRGRLASFDVLDPVTCGSAPGDLHGCATGPTWSGNSSARIPTTPPRRGSSPPTAATSTCPRPDSSMTPRPGGCPLRVAPARRLPPRW